MDNEYPKPLYIRLRALEPGEHVARTVNYQQLGKVMIDLDAKDEIIGIEILEYLDVELDAVKIIAMHKDAIKVVVFLQEYGLSEFNVAKKKSYNEIFNKRYAKETDGEYLWVQGKDLLNYGL